MPSAIPIRDIMMGFINDSSSSSFSSDVGSCKAGWSMDTFIESNANEEHVNKINHVWLEVTQEVIVRPYICHEQSHVWHEAVSYPVEKYKPRVLPLIYALSTWGLFGRILDIPAITWVYSSIEGPEEQHS